MIWFPLGPPKFRGIMNGKAGRAAALPKFSDTLLLGA
jgi:hypothetical protein